MHAIMAIAYAGLQSYPTAEKHAREALELRSGSLGEEHLLLVPNHYKAVGQSIDMGIPILEYAPNSPVIKALSKICAKFMGEPNSFLIETDSKGSNAIERLKQWSPF